ncbi:COG0582: Integrase [Pseudoalteromonas luteoviolacea B = ATCC 29581]|nr:COG0582: Integrase [Pseudoalteromonas luteoviolacea B = ATCC 29581]
MFTVGIAVKKEFYMATITQRENGKWQAKIRRKGFKDQSKTFALKKDAKRWVREVETRMDQSIFKSTDVAEEMLVSSALERYWDEHLINAKSADNILSMINRLKKVFVGLTLIDVTVHTIRDYKTYRLESVKGDTVRKEMSLIQRMFTYAMNEWDIYLPSGNPVAPVSLPPKGRARDRRLYKTEKEEERLLAAARAYGGPLHDIIVIALETGMRRGEMVNSRRKTALAKHGYACMRWEHFDEEGSTIFLEDTKNKESRTVPLTEKAKQIILAQPRKPSGPIFDIRGDSVGAAFRKIVKRIGIDDLRFHDLRHEATSRLFEKGLQMMEVAAITGHKDLASLKRYTHLCPKNLAEKLAKSA